MLADLHVRQKNLSASATSHETCHAEVATNLGLSFCHTNTSHLELGLGIEYLSAVGDEEMAGCVAEMDRRPWGSGT